MVIELQNNCATAGGTVGAVRPERCLRRLANVFSRVLELPFSAGATVTVLNFADFYCFFASSTRLTDGQVQPHLIRYRTMIKLIVGEPGMVRDDMELNRWRLRLPESTRPELTSVFCKNGILIVIVPKAGVVKIEEGYRGDLEKGKISSVPIKTFKIANFPIKIL